MIESKIVFEVIVLYNITQIVAESTLFSKVRKIKIVGSVLSCFLCTSVWISFLLTFVLFDYANYLGFDKFSWFFNGMFFSGLTWFIHVIERKLSR